MKQRTWLRRHITENQGDARNADERVEGLKFDTDGFPPSDELQNVFGLARIRVSDIEGDTDGDGDFDQALPSGGRSFAIWDAHGNPVTSIRPVSKCATATAA